MEAATLPKKKTISKRKVKKTIKNVLCRPDTPFWPNISDDQAKTLEVALSEYKVDIPEFKKLHWKELKLIPKDQRPKPPKIKKVEGLLFGIIECSNAVRNKECSAIVIESSVTPHTIVQPLIEAAISTKVPIVCMNRLKNITATNFGISTSCLGIKNNFLQDIKSKITEIAILYKAPEPISVGKGNTQMNMEIDENIAKKISHHVNNSISCPYLYRTSKKTRTFNPSLEESKVNKEFIGQDFIELSGKTAQNGKSGSKAYMSMILKRITNNQNRVKRK